VNFPGLLTSGEQKEIYDRQCSGPGALLSFELVGGDEAKAFRFLNAVRLIKLAVSLGGNESLIEHPATMTHADVPPEEQLAIGITPALIRLSVGIEHPDDLIADLSRAAEQLEVPNDVPVEAPSPPADPVLSGEVV
jgi:methionine-gamma-lyase